MPRATGTTVHLPAVQNKQERTVCPIRSDPLFILGDPEVDNELTRKPHFGLYNRPMLNQQNNVKLGDPEVTVNLYCDFAFPHWEGCRICSIYLR